MTTARTTLKSSSIHGTGMFDDRAPPSLPHPPPLATPHEARMVLAADRLWYPSADEPIILHDQRRGPDEVCAAVELIDPRLGPALLGELGHRIGGRALEPHELGPIDRQRSRPRPHSREPPCRGSASARTVRRRHVSRPPQPSTPPAGSVTPRPTPIAPPSFVSLPIGGAR